MDWKIQTPVAFIIFNRPETTRRVLAELRRVRPPMLLVIADGPRSNRSGEADRCALARAVVDEVDWPCEVLRNFSSHNLGCRNRVASGLDWVFDQVPEAIILEDDCVPEPTFFRFCEELLVRYRDDERIGHIGGASFQFGRRRTPDSYYFSRYAHVWGWATWRRAWAHYQRDAGGWPEFEKGNWLEGLLPTQAARRFWRRKFEAVYRGRIDTWDFQWVLACWRQGMLSVVPEVNLVKNVGFGADATHTRRDSVLSRMGTEPLSFPLRHPGVMQPHAGADSYTSQTILTPSIPRRAWQLLCSVAAKPSGPSLFTTP
jgi:hypothetical protein